MVYPVKAFGKSALRSLEISQHPCLQTFSGKWPSQMHQPETVCIITPKSGELCGAWNFAEPINSSLAFGNTLVVCPVFFL
jgi:CO dehydrogenase/acetyl-CoA synthase beta subunit